MFSIRDDKVGFQFTISSETLLLLSGDYLESKNEFIAWLSIYNSSLLTIE